MDIGGVSGTQSSESVVIHGRWYWNIWLICHNTGEGLEVFQKVKVFESKQLHCDDDLEMAGTLVVTLGERLSTGIVEVFLDAETLRQYIYTWAVHLDAEPLRQYIYTWGNTFILGHCNDMVGYSVVTLEKDCMVTVEDSGSELSELVEVY